MITSLSTSVWHCVCTEFDQVVRESRKEAEQAVQRIPEIEENIRDAENSTYWALAALYDADAYASVAEELAVAARNKSNSALVVRDVVAYRHNCGLPFTI